MTEEQQQMRFIAETYGIFNQQRQLVEEMAELTKAICKMERYWDKTLTVEAKYFELEENLVEEIADVQLMLHQLIYLLNADDKVADVVHQKIKRTLERIGVENASN